MSRTVTLRHTFIASLITIGSILLLQACGGGGKNPPPPPSSTTSYNDISAYTLNATTGAPTQIDCGGVTGCNAANFRAGTGPNSVTVDPSGKFAYVANSSSDDISAYTLNATTGALTQIDCGGGTGCNAANFRAGGDPLSVTTIRTIR